MLSVVVENEIIVVVDFWIRNDMDIVLIWLELLWIIWIFWNNLEKWIEFFMEYIWVVCVMWLCVWWVVMGFIVFGVNDCVLNVCNFVYVICRWDYREDWWFNVRWFWGKLWCVKVVIGFECVWCSVCIYFDNVVCIVYLLLSWFCLGCMK